MKIRKYCLKIKFFVFSPRKFFKKYLKIIKGDFLSDFEVRYGFCTRYLKYHGWQEFFRMALRKIRRKFNPNASYASSSDYDFENNKETQEKNVETLANCTFWENMIEKFSPGKKTISVFVPFDFASQDFGGGQRVFNVYSELSKYFNINLIGVSGVGEVIGKRKINESLVVYLIPTTSYFQSLLQKEQIAADGLLHDILLTYEYLNIPLLWKFCQKLNSSSEIFVSSHPYFFRMFRQFCPHKILVYEAHNVDWELKKTYFKDLSNKRAQYYLKMVKDVENFACQGADIITAVSSFDLNGLVNTYRFDHQKAVIVPNGLDFNTYLKSEGIKNKKKKRVIFVGSCHGPNIEAVNYITDELASDNRDVEFLIVGNIKNHFKERVLPVNVIFTGAVSEEEKFKLYDSADLAINPMFSGSGTNIKLIEYVAVKLPVLSTPFGLRGLEVLKEHVPTAEKENFSNELKRQLLQPKRKIQNQVESAWQLGLKVFDKSQIVNDFVTKINNIFKNKAEKKLHIVIDGRLLGRAMTGTERYIAEIAKNVFKKFSRQSNFSLLTSFKFLSDVGAGVMPIVGSEGLFDADVYHRTFQVGSDVEVAMMQKSKCSVFTPHDLILCRYSDYFNSFYEFNDFKLSMGKACQSADRIIAISNHAKNDLIDMFKVPESKIDVVYHGMDHQKFFPVSDISAKEELREKYSLPKRFILYIGTDYPHKNVKNLLISLMQLSIFSETSDVKLVMVGKKAYSKGEEYLRPFFHPIREKVIDLGSIPDEDIPILYSVADIFVFPSLYEGFGFPVIEAMACGTPVICSNATSLPEVAGDAAYLVDARYPENITKAVINIFRDNNLRQALIKRGLEQARKFTWESSAEQTYEIYKRTHKEKYGY